MGPITKMKNFSAEERIVEAGRECWGGKLGRFSFGPIARQCWIKWFCTDICWIYQPLYS